MTETWGFLDSGLHDAATNMALDEALLRWHSQGRIPPTLRLYGWSRPSLSIGHFQKMEYIDFDGLQKHGCQLVRRLTGGSAVLHDNELTYSIVISENHHAIPTSITEAYHVLSKGVLQGYRNLGIAACYATPGRERDKNITAICFEKTAYYEMVFEGKKISGNAQTRKQGTLLQHGSIPMSINAHMLFDLFAFPSEAVRQKKKSQFIQKAITMDQIKLKKHSYGEVKQAFYTGFQHGLDISLRPIVLTNSQWEEVHSLAKSNYLLGTLMDAK
ncbi:biotin/lipoate A/B protein ligase family protein [Virgibacillus halophilus]|uniref:lipoate--protein ligase family protein n=1 Tax=Tigheibacillus halophilus TaxID=361280 RepID=UPI0036361C17